MLHAACRGQGLRPVGLAIRANFAPLRAGAAPLRKLVLVRLPILRALLLPDSPSGTSLRACMVRNELGRFRAMLPRIPRRNLRSRSALKNFGLVARSVRHASLVLSLKLPPRARRRARVRLDPPARCCHVGRGRSARCDRSPLSIHMRNGTRVVEIWTGRGRGHRRYGTGGRNPTPQVRSRSRHPGSKPFVKSTICMLARVQDSSS